MTNQSNSFQARYIGVKKFGYKFLKKQKNKQTSKQQSKRNCCENVQGTVVGYEVQSLPCFKEFFPTEERLIKQLTKMLTEAISHG